MLYIYTHIPEALRHLMLNARTSACIKQKGYTIFPYINHYIYPKSTQALIMLNARTSAWVNQKGYTSFPFIDHEWKAKYVTYPRSTQALHWMPGLQLGLTREDTQHFPILAMTEKLSMLYIPEVLRHYIECQDFSLGEPERIHIISLYWPWMKS